MEDNGTFSDPVLELARRIDADNAFSVFELAASDDEARTVLGVLDEVEAEAQAAEFGAGMRRAGLLW